MSLIFALWLIGGAIALGIAIGDSIVNKTKLKFWKCVTVVAYSWIFIGMLFGGYLSKFENKYFKEK